VNTVEKKSEECETVTPLLTVTIAVNNPRIIGEQ
jgi:hypothetical protein